MKIIGKKRLYDALSTIAFLFMTATLIAIFYFEELWLAVFVALFILLALWVIFTIRYNQCNDTPPQNAP